MTYRLAVSAFALAFASMSAFAQTEGSAVDVPAPPPAGEASEATAAANRAVAERLPLDDQGDFDDASRGFLAAIEGDAILDEDGNTVNHWLTTGFLAASASSNETALLTHKVVRSLGMLAFDNQARV